MRKRIRYEPLAARIIRSTHDIGARQVTNTCLVLHTIDGCIHQIRFLCGHCTARVLQSAAAIWFVAHLTPKPVKVVNHLTEGRKRTGIAGSKFPEIIGRAVEFFMGEGAQAGRRPGDPVVVSRKHFVSRQGAGIDAACIHVHDAVRRVLNAVDNNEALWRPGADCLSDSRNINSHSGNRTGLNNSGDPCVFIHARRIVLCGDHRPFFVMGNTDVLFVRNRAPPGSRTDSGRVLKRAADHVASGRRAQDRCPHKTKKQFGSALAGKYDALFDAKEGFHVFSRLVDDPNKFMRGGIIPALVIRYRREVAVNFDDRFQGQRSASVLKKDSRTLVWAMIYMVEAVTNLAQKIGIKH